MGILLLTFLCLRRLHYFPAKRKNEIEMINNAEMRLVLEQILSTREVWSFRKIDAFFTLKVFDDF